MVWCKTQCTMSLSEILTVKAAICPFCRELGAKVLIDDNPIYAVECANAGINVLLYDWHLTYPWSKTADGYVAVYCSLACCPVAVSIAILKMTG